MNYGFGRGSPRHSRQSPYNWGKRNQTFINIAIRPVFIPKKLASSPPKNEPQRMVCCLVKISLDQYQQLDRLRKERKESLSKLMRETLSHFTKKKEHSISVLPSFLPTCTKEQYKTVTAYFRRHDWNLLERISKSTGKCQTELVRDALDDYLNGVNSARDRIRMGKTSGSKTSGSNSLSGKRYAH